jgi:hypothetical protein
MRRLLAVVFAVLLLLGVAGAPARAGVPVANMFTVSTKVSSLTAGKTYPFTFRLFDAAVAGNELFVETMSYKVPTSKKITHLLGRVNLVQPLQAEDFLQQVWVEVSTGKKFFPRIQLGPAPLAIGSQEADQLDGLHAADFAAAGHTHGGPGSGLDADLFDGQDSSFYQSAANLVTGTLGTARYSAYADLGDEGYLGNDFLDIAQNNGVLQTLLFANKALVAEYAWDSASAKSAEALSDAALSVLDIRYGLAPSSQGLAAYTTATTVDSTGSVGQYTSITIGADGLPVIAYWDNTNFRLKVLHCGNAACNSGNTTATADTNPGLVGQYASITIAADGLPVIAYFSLNIPGFKVLHCGNAACNSGNTTSFMDLGNVGGFTSTTIGADGFPIISYFDMTNRDLKVLHCATATCSSGGSITTVDSADEVGWYTSITIGVDGLPVISYLDRSSDLKVLHCDTAGCVSGGTSTTVDSLGTVGYHTSITIGADCLPVISYYDYSNSDLKVLHCGNADCSSGNTATTVDSTGDVGSYTSITIGADSLPIISYYDSTNGDLKLLHCGNAACSSGNTAITVDSTGDVGSDSSITIGADGLPIISYYDRTNGDLKVAHMFLKPRGRR